MKQVLLFLAGKVRTGAENSIGGKPVIGYGSGFADSFQVLVSTVEALTEECPEILHFV